MSERNREHNWNPALVWTADEELDLICGGAGSSTPLAGKGVPMPGREFGDYDERPAQHNVAVAEFYLGAREVTNAEYLHRIIS